MQKYVDDMFGPTMYDVGDKGEFVVRYSFGDLDDERMNVIISEVHDDHLVVDRVEEDGFKSSAVIYYWEIRSSIR